MSTSLFARCFNATNEYISYIKVGGISPTSGGNDSRKRHENRLILKIGTIHPQGLNDDFLLFDPFIVSVFLYM